MLILFNSCHMARLQGNIILYSFTSSNVMLLMLCSFGTREQLLKKKEHRFMFSVYIERATLPFFQFKLPWNSAEIFWRNVGRVLLNRSVWRHDSSSHVYRNPNWMDIVDEQWDSHLPGGGTPHGTATPATLLREAISYSNRPSAVPELIIR